MFSEAFKGVIQISSEKNCAESFTITSVVNSSIVDSSLSKSVKYFLIQEYSFYIISIYVDKGY